jgi:nucleoside-diphosphate-sugar epimerase
MTRVRSNSELPVALVTGATGAVGPALVARLFTSGHRVRVFSRHPDREVWNDSVTLHRGDVLDAMAIKTAMAGADVVFHLAALVHVVEPRPSRRAEYARVNVDGTRAVVDAAVAARVQRVVMFSTIAVYGPTSGHIVDETDVPHPDSYYAETKLAAEKIVLETRRADGVPLGTVLRLGAVYGPRMKGNYRELVHALSRGWFVPVGPGANRRTLIFDTDVADAATAVAQSSHAVGRIYNVTDRAFHPMREIIAAICRALGRKAPRLCLPVAPIRAAAATLETIARAAGLSPPVRAATVEKYLEDVAVRGDLITAEVGWVPRVDLQTGWNETVLGLKRLGVLNRVSTDPSPAGLSRHR